MTLIDGDKIVTAQLYDDEHEEFIEEKMSIIEYVNVYTTEGVTVADDVLGKIRAEIESHRRKTKSIDPYDLVGDCLDIIDKYKAESEDKE